MYEAATSPQSIGGVLDSGFRLYKASLGSTFLLALVAGLISAPLNRMTRTIDPNDPAIDALGSVLGGALVVTVVSLVFYGALTIRIQEHAHGRALSTADALLEGLRRALALFVAYLCYFLAMLIGLILLVVPGLFVMIAFAFGPFAAVVERKGPIDSLFYSRELVRGRWWRTAGILTVIGIIILCVSMLLSFVTTIPILMAPERALDPTLVPWWVDYVLSPLLAGLFTPLWLSLVLAVYNDLKLRHEGGDIAARIAAADA